MYTLIALIIALIVTHSFFQFYVKFFQNPIICILYSFELLPPSRRQAKILIDRNTRNLDSFISKRIRVSQHATNNQ